MTENKKYCMGCMKEIDIDASVCPHCYYNEETVQHYPCLPKGSIIAERYLIGKATAMANDSITYIGVDSQTEEIVSVHEFYPAKITERAQDTYSLSVKSGCDEIFDGCLQSFIAMWKAIGSVQGEPALPCVRNILDYNGTVYTVCKYSDSISLKAYFEETRKPLTWQKAQSAFKGIFSALEKLHGVSVIHGGISPSSVQVGSDGKLHLTAFTIPECHGVNGYLAGAPVSGFSPLEFYEPSGNIDTSSDVYSLMALMYFSVTGIVPSKATDRAMKDEMVIPSSVAASLSKRVIGAFIRGLSVRCENRIRSVTELRSLIYPAASASQPQQRNVRPASSAQKQSPAQQKAVASAKENKGKRKKSKKDSSLAVIAIGTFTAVVVFCMLVFSVLYTTVLYKNYDVPVLNKMFASFDFLPMNKVEEEIQLTEPVETAQSAVAQSRYVTVPDFTAHTYDSITTNTTFNKNFKFEFKFEYNDKHEKNSVISQDLVKGESVLAGTTVKLLVSRGAEQIELPEVIGLKYSDASAELKEKGFKVKKVVLENDGTHPEGIVEMTDKVAGLEFDKGTEIILSVWDEIEEETTEKTTKKNNKNNKKTDKSDE